MRSFIRPFLSLLLRHFEDVLRSTASTPITSIFLDICPQVHEASTLAPIQRSNHPHLPLITRHSRMWPDQLALASTQNILMFSPSPFSRRSSACGVNCGCAKVLPHLRSSLCRPRPAFHDVGSSIPNDPLRRVAIWNSEVFISGCNGAEAGSSIQVLSLRQCMRQLQCTCRIASDTRSLGRVLTPGYDVRYGQVSV